MGIQYCIISYLCPPSVSVKIGICRYEKFKCNSGQCIALERACDGVNHCSDRSDEPNDCTFLRVGDTVGMYCLEFPLLSLPVIFLIQLHYTLMVRRLQCVE